MKVFAPRGVEIYARREMRGLIDNQRKRLEENSARKATYVERQVDLMFRKGEIPFERKSFLVVKLLRAHEGCLGIGGRRRTW